MKKHFIYKYGLLLSVLIAIGCGSCQKDNYVQYDAAVGYCGRTSAECESRDGN